MGQRLVVHVTDDIHSDPNEPIASIYYHWSDYTVPAYEELRDLLTYLRTYNDVNPLIRLARGIIERGGLIDNHDKEEISRAPEWVEALGEEAIQRTGDRSAGILSLSPASIAQSVKWEEGTANLNVSNEICDIDAFYWYAGKDELMECEEMDEEEFEEGVFDMICDPTSMTLDDVSNSIRCLGQNREKFIMHFPDGSYGRMIE